MPKASWFFTGSGLQTIAAVWFIAKDVWSWFQSTGRKSGAHPFIVKRPLVLSTLILGCIATSSYGFWLVFHPPLASVGVVKQQPALVNNPSSASKVDLLKSDETSVFKPRKKPTISQQLPASPPPSDVSQPVQIEAPNNHGNVASNNYGTQTYNQFGAEKLLITATQQLEIVKAMKPFSGLKFALSRNKPTEDSDKFATDLKRALTDAGLICVQDGTVLRLNAMPGGVDLYISDSGLDSAGVLANVLVEQGINQKNVPAEMVHVAAYDFMITVSPNQ